MKAASLPPLSLLNIFVASVTTTQAYSVPQPRQFIDIINPLQLSTTQERLPAGLIQNWPTWTWSVHSKQWKNIQGQDDVLGFVNPYSIDYLWQPVDLNPPQCTLALAIHCRDGVPRHLLPAVDISYGEECRHKNRGLHTSPRAWQWFDFNSYVAGTRNCRLELRTIDLSTTAEAAVDNCEKLQTFYGVEKLVDSLLEALSDEPPSEFSDGSVIIQVTATTADSFELPKQKRILSAALLEDDDKLMGSLDVMVLPVAAGSQSKYLPDVYRPLFQSEVRPEYKKFQQRKAARGQ